MDNPYKPISEAIIFLVCGEWISYEKFLQKYKERGMYFGDSIRWVSPYDLSRYLLGFPWDKTKTAIFETANAFVRIIEEKKEQIANYNKRTNADMIEELKSQIKIYKRKLSTHYKISNCSPLMVESLIQEALKDYTPTNPATPEWEAKLEPFGEIWHSGRDPSKKKYAKSLVMLERVVEDQCKERNIDRQELKRQIDVSIPILKELYSDMERAKEKFINAAILREIEIGGINEASEGNVVKVPNEFLRRKDYKINFPIIEYHKWTDNPQDTFFVHPDLTTRQFAESRAQIEKFKWRDLQVKMEEIENLREIKKDKVNETQHINGRAHKDIINNIKIYLISQARNNNNEIPARDKLEEVTIKHFEKMGVKVTSTMYRDAHMELRLESDRHSLTPAKAGKKTKK